MQPVVEISQPLMVAAVRRRATPQTLAGLIRGSGVWELMRARGIENTGHNVVIYRDEAGQDLMHSAQGIPVEIGAEVREAFVDDDQLICTRTPGGRTVSIRHIGRIEGLHVAYSAIHAHVRIHGLPLAGPYWEYYGHWSDDPDRFETTVSFALLD
ncbi:MAG TPA: GyrI-like domain-containing protein [Devosia sp.]|nr:GyrI-like domain-containing protein [Devosia sp.]